MPFESRPKRRNVPWQGSDTGETGERRTGRNDENGVRRPRLLDLFCCAGGAAVGYHRAGFDVVGIDIEPQPNYPFEFHQADAIDYLLGNFTKFDAIHASPPCQGYTTLALGNNANASDYPQLIDMTRAVLEATNRPYVIENVASAPLRQDLMLCGLMFGLKVFRHRKFELGRWLIDHKPHHPTHKGHRVAGWRHGIKYDGDMVAVYGDGGGKGSLDDWRIAMDIDWMQNKHELAESIPPAYTEHIGNQLFKWLASQ